MDVYMLNENFRMKTLVALEEAKQKNQNQNIKNIVA